MNEQLSTALKKKIIMMPAAIKGKVTAIRVQRLLEKEEANVSLSTIARIWREAGVSPRTHPRFDDGYRGHLFHILAETPPRELGLEKDYWTLGRFRKYLQLVGLVEHVSRKTIAHFLDSNNIERPSSLWPRSDPLPSVSNTPVDSDDSDNSDDLGQ